MSVHCLSLDGVYYWARLDLADANSLRFNLADAGYGHDVGGSSWLVGTDRGCDGNYETVKQASIDSIYRASFNGASGQTFLFRDRMWVDIPGGRYLDGHLEDGIWAGQYLLPSESGCFAAIPQNTQLSLNGIADGSG